MTSDYDELISLLKPHGQQHLLRFWDKLNPVQQQELGEEIRRLDIGVLTAARSGAGQDATHDLSRAVIPPAIRLQQPDRETWAQSAQHLGAEALSAGKVGCLLVAGGQGSRLGFDHPKGMFSIGPVSGASLFQILLEKIVATRDRYGAAVPLFLMTSPATDDETVAYLSEQRNFGLAEDDVHIFCQGTLPAIDAQMHKLLLAEPGHLALSPDGHGGMLEALKRSGGLDALRRRGVEHLFYFQVDNPLAQVCDPETIGAHLMAQSEYTLQVVNKRDPGERVGVVVSIDGQMRVVEYSDLPAEAAAERAPDGGLKLWAGSIAVHMFAVDFLQRMAADPQSLPLHRALKKVPYLDEQGRTVQPQQPNAIKLERFIFDLLPHAARGLVVEVDPAAAFAPVKNAPGEKIETPEYVQDYLMAQARRWLAAAGAEVAEGVRVEISPRFALDAAELATKINSGTKITRDTYFT
ncbi:MAG: UDPGP type 1 family protein [Planctomycetes bacterium]|nr:UDPGP type 1 family protein [Planctomycetota bacterium]